MRFTMHFIVVLCLFTSPVYAKTLNISDIIDGLFDSGDTLSEPVSINAPKVVEPLHPLKSSKIIVDKESMSLSPIDAKTKNSLGKKQKDDDDPIEEILPAKENTPIIGGGWSMPSFGSSTISYTDDMDYLQSQLTTPSKTMSYMQANYSYVGRNNDKQYSPAELNYYRSGDCKDFTTFFSTMIASHGYSVTEYVFKYGDNLGHVVAIFEDDDSQWYVQSNLNIYGPIGSAEEGMALSASYGLPAGSTVGTYKSFSAGYMGQLTF